MKQRNVNSPRFVWIGLTAVLAILCLVFRLWQLNTAFENNLGLPIRHAPASVALIAALILAAVVLLLQSIRQKEVQPPRGAERRLRSGGTMLAQGNTVCLTLNVVAAFLALAAAPVMLLEGWKLRMEHIRAIAVGAEHTNNGILLMITGVSALLAFAGLLLSGRDRFRGIREGKGEQCVMMAAVNGGLWLMESYRSNAADPVLWDYVPLLLAIVCGMLFYTDCAGLAAGAPHPRRTLWMSGATVIISAVAIAGRCDLGDRLLLAAQILAALAILWQLPMNMEYPPAAEEPAASEEETQEEDQNV